MGKRYRLLCIRSSTWRRDILKCKGFYKEFDTLTEMAAFMAKSIRKLNFPRFLYDLSKEDLQILVQKLSCKSVMKITEESLR